MRADLKDIIAGQPTQHSLNWYRVRLGKFTGSQVGRLMKRGKGGEYFAKDAMSYITEVVAERMLNPSVVYVDELFEEYLLQATATSKAMAWGSDQEMNARGLYASLRKCKVTSCGAVEVEGTWFASSPDGVLLDEDGVIEIKCPTNTTHTAYMRNVHDAESLKAVKPEYYWQCMSHMMVTGAKFCDWMSYCPFSKKPLHVVRIDRDDDALIELREHITAAEREAMRMYNEMAKDISGGCVMM